MLKSKNFCSGKLLKNMKGINHPTSRHIHTTAVLARKLPNQLRGSKPKKDSYPEHFQHSFKNNLYQSLGHYQENIVPVSKLKLTINCQITI